MFLWPLTMWSRRIVPGSSRGIWSWYLLKKKNPRIKQKQESQESFYKPLTVLAGVSLECRTKQSTVSQRQEEEKVNSDRSSYRLCVVGMFSLCPTGSLQVLWLPLHLKDMQISIWLQALTSIVPNFTLIIWVTCSPKQTEILFLNP